VTRDIANLWLVYAKSFSFFMLIFFVLVYVIWQPILILIRVVSGEYFVEIYIIFLFVSHQIQIILICWAGPLFEIFLAQ